MCLQDLQDLESFNGIAQSLKETYSIIGLTYSTLFLPTSTICLNNFRWPVETTLKMIELFHYMTRNLAILVVHLSIGIMHHINKRNHIFANKFVEYPEGLRPVICPI